MIEDEQQSYTILGIKYYSPKAIAKVLSVTPPTVRKLAISGELQSARIGKNILITKDSLVSYLKRLHIDLETIEKNLPA